MNVRMQTTHKLVFQCHRIFVLKHQRTCMETVDKKHIDSNNNIGKYYCGLVVIVLYSLFIHNICFGCL